MRIPYFALSLVGFAILFSCSKDSEPQEAPDTIAPQVDLSIAGLPSGTEGEPTVVGSQIVINVEAADAGGIAGIEAFINEQKVGEDKTAPYSITLNLSSFTSKVGKSTDFIDYTLKVVATDLAGNTASTEQTIHIDDSMPTITEVSLETGAVLNGNTNPLMFDILENDELSSVTVFVNEELSATLTEGEYTFNIDTSVLPEGENKVRIEAKDMAGNTGSHTVPFLVDTTGPEIRVESLQDGQILDELIALDPQVTDAYSDVSLVTIYWGEDVIYSAENGSEIRYDLDPNEYPIGGGTIKIYAEDALGNSSEIEWAVEILRLLLKVTIPEGYLSPNITTNHFVIASGLEGEVIDFKEVIFETREVRLYADGEFDMEKEFTVTFASLGRNGVASYLVSLSHVNRSNLQELNLIVPDRYSGVGANYYPITGFSESTQLFCFGRDYYFSSSEAGDTLIQDFVPSNHGTESGPLYLYGFNPLNNFYNYQFVNRPIDPDFEIDFADFSVENMVEREITTLPEEYSSNARHLSLFGYLSQEDVVGDRFHQLWSYGYGQNMGSNVLFQLNTQFPEYAHDLRIGDYQSKGIGLPPAVAQIPDWSFDYTFQNNSVALTKSGVGHTVGELYLEGGYDTGTPYVWNVFFNSNKEGDIVLPNIPEALQAYPMYNVYQSNSLELARVALRKYDNINTYDGFLEEVIKPNNVFQRAAPRYESIFSGTSQAFLNTSYFFNYW